MSSSIDQRIVEMQFDNKEFESGIQTSLKSIRKLEDGLQLKDSAKGFENLGKAANNVSFDGLNAGVVAVQQKFSAMEIVAISALQNIVNKAMSAGEHLVKSLSLDQISAGFEKFGAKTTSVATLIAQGYNIDEVSAQLDRLNTFTDETSYNFTDMVANIAKFTATGKSLTESVTAMEGIANWAAMSGQNAQTASRAMYQLAQAMGAGVMRLEDYKSIQNASMDTDEFRKKCIAAAVSLGTLKDNGNETYSVVSKGAKATAFNVSQFTTQLTDGAWLTSDVMMSVFNDYSKAVTEIVDASSKRSMTVSEIIEEIHSKSEQEGISLSQSIKDLGYSFDEFSLKSFEAAQKARTFNDAIDSVKDAVSTGWMKTFEIIFGNANEATELWTSFANDLYDIFAEGGNARNDFLEEVMGDSKTFTEEQWKVVESNNSANNALQKALMETAKEHGIAIDSMVNDQTSFQESLKQGWLTTDIFTETLKKFTSETTVSATDLTDKLTEYKKIAADVIQGNYGNGEARKKALADAGHDYTTIQGIVNKMLAGTEIAVTDLGEQQLKEIGYTDEQVVCLRKLAQQAEETGTPISELIEKMNRPSGRELLIESFSNALHGLMTVIETVKSAWSDVFPPKSAEEVYNIIKAVNKFSQILNISDGTADKLKRTLKGLFSIFGIVTDAVSLLAGRAFKILGAVLGDVNVDVLGFTANIGNNIVKLREWLRSNEVLNTALDKMTNFIVDGIAHIKDWIQNNETLNSILTKFNSALVVGVTAIRNWVSEHKAVSTMLEKIGATFTKVITLLAKAKTKLVEWFAAFKQLPIVQSAFKAFGKIFEKFLSGAKQLLEDLSPYISDFFDKFKNLDGISFSDLKGLWEILKNDAGEALQTIIDKIFGLNSAIDTFKQKVGDLVSFAKDRFSGLTAIISTVRDIVSKGLKNVAVDKIISAGVGIGVIASLKKLSDVLGGVKKMGANIGDAFVGVLGGVKNVLVAYQKDIEANSIIKIAAAIGILAVAIIALAQVPTERMIPAAIALGIVGSAIVGLATALEYVKGKFGNKIDTPLTALSQTLKGFSVGFNAAAIAASVVLIVKALKEMESLDTNGLGTRVRPLVGIIGALSLVGVAMSKLGGNQFGSAVYLVAMAFSLKTVIKALADLQGYSLDSIWSSLGKMSLILGALALVCKAASGAKFGSAVTLIAAAFSLKMLIDVLDDIAAMPLENILKGLAAIVPIMTMMALVNLTTVAAGKSGDGGKSVLLMAAGMYVMIEVIKEISSISTSDLAKGIAVLAAMTTILTMYSVVSLISSQNGNADKQALGFIGMAAGIAILVGAIWAINQIGVDECWQALGVITAISAVFAALMAVSKLATGSEKTIIALTACVAALTIMVVAISNIPISDLGPATIAIDSIMACMALLMATSNLAKQATPGILVVTLAVAAIGALLYALSGVPNPQALIPIAESMSLVLIAVSAAMAVLSAVPVAGVAQAGIAILAGVGVIVAIMEALGALMQLDLFSGNLDRGIDAIGKIGEAIGSFVGGIVGGFAAGVTSGLPKIGENVASFITNLVPAMLMMNTVDKSAVDGAVNLAEAVVAITAKNFISGIFNFLSGGIDYESLKTQFEGLGNAVKAFADSTNGVNANNVKTSADAVQVLSDVINAIAPSGGAWQDFVGTIDIGNFADGIKSIGDAIAAYSKSIENVDPDVVTKSSAAAQTLVDLENSLPPSGGALQSFLGSKDISTFGTQLSEFGTYLAAYSAAITGADGGYGVNTEAITSTEAACKMLIELENSLPSDGGMLQNFLGHQNLGEFGKQLSLFASGMADYSNALTKDGGIDTEAITSSEDACTMLVDLATAVNQLNGTDGWDAFWSSSETLGEFAEDIGEFGENLKIFSDNIADVDFTKISSAITNLNRLVTVLKSLNAEDVRIGALTELGYALNSFDANSSFFDLFDGAFDKMEEAGKTFIQKFIDGVVSKATEMTDTANQTVTKFTGDITTAIQSSVPLVTIEIDNMMIAVESAITNHEPTVTEAFNSLLTAIINTFKTRQPEFTNEGSANAKSYADGVSGSEAPDIALQSMTEDSIRIIHEKGPAFIDAGTQTAESIGTGISQNTSTVDAVNATMNTSLQSIQNRQGDFYSSGVGSATNVSNGFASKQGASVGTVENLITACVSKINAMRTDFLTAGTYAIGGFIEGFTSKIQSAAESAANLARSALNAAKSALDINSPSKEFAWLGEMSGEGYIQAMHKMVSKVSQSGTELGNTAVNSTTLALESLMDLVNNGIDTTPTIRPVIDLSDVESGVTALNGLMTAPRTLSLAGSINRVNAVSNSMDASRSDYASSNQNGGKAVEYGPMTINVYGAVGQDVNELANMVMEKVQHKVERTGAMWE